MTRDHTLNNEFGHVLYLWNQKKQVGRVESPLITNTGPGDCTLRFYFVYRSKMVNFGSISGNQIGEFNLVY